MKRMTGVLLAFWMMAVSAMAMAGDGAQGNLITLRGWNATDGYQYIQLGYYPYTSDGTYAPVVWRVLAVNEQTVLLQSAYALDIYRGNRYSHPSDIYRDFAECFTHTTLFERSLILMDSTLSASDLRLSRYGFSDEKGNDYSRSVEPTPYAAAKGISMENGYVPYWTYDADRVHQVTPAGSILPVNYTVTLAVVPTISIGANALHMDKGSGTLADPYASSDNEISLWLEQNMHFDIASGVTYTIRNDERRALATYSGPGLQYYRQPNSQITARSAQVSILAKKGNWVMIEYKTGRPDEVKLLKTAWIYRADMGQSGTLNQLLRRMENVLPAYSLAGEMAEETELYDDKDMVRGPLYTLWEGQEIEFLGYTEIQGLTMAYIETEIYEKPVRGFVPIGSIELDEYEIRKLLNLTGE